MNTKAAPSVVQIGTEELRALVTPVAETLATEVMIKQSKPIQKKFGISDLQRIRRKRRFNDLIIR